MLTFDISTDPTIKPRVLDSIADTVLITLGDAQLHLSQDQARLLAESLNRTLIDQRTQWSLTPKARAFLTTPPIPA